MGKPKESLPFADSTMLGRTTELLLGCTWPVLVIGRGQDQQLPPLPLEATVIQDEQPGSGPLAAIATGMRHLCHNRLLGDQDAVFVTGCDAPYLSADTIGWLASQLGSHQAVVPRAGGVLQPLCAIYRLNCLPAIEELLRSGIDTPRTIAEQTKALILEEPVLRTFDAELRFLLGVNTPEDYDEAQRRASR